jgi:hypothetical protein
MPSLVARIDDNGTVPVVCDGLDAASAAAPAAEMAARGHKQACLDLSCADGAERARRRAALGDDSRRGDGRPMSGPSTSRRSPR